MAKKTLIIGGGPAGLTAAFFLTQQKQPVTVFEAGPRLGGLAQTVNYKGNRFDIGGHRFLTKMKEIFNLWIEIIGRKNFLKVKRLSRIYYQDKFYHYPIKPLEALNNLGLRKALEIFVTYAWVKIFPKRKGNNFHDWMVNRFGITLFNIFFKTYTEKVIGLSTKQLSADWAKQRVKGLSLSQAIISAFIKKPNRIKTLSEEFHYPKCGPGQMWQACGKKIIRNGGEILLFTKVVKIYWQNRLATKLITHHGTANKLWPVKGALLSTMPMSLLVKTLDPLPPRAIRLAAGKLRYRDFITVGLIVSKKQIFPDNWIYIHSPELKVGRIQNYKNWSKAMVKNPKTNTTLGLEYFCNEGDNLWQLSDKQLLNLAANEIAKMGLIHTKQIIDGVVIRAKKAYPVYDLNYQQNVMIIKNWLEFNIKNLILVGRNGMHRYNNQDHSMLAGLQAAKNILYSQHYNLWKIDPDASET